MAEIVHEIPEQQEQANIILITALNRLRAMGYAVKQIDADKTP